MKNVMKSGETFGTMTPEIYEAVEEYRKKKNLKNLHVTLGPDATPENIISELEKVDQQLDEFGVIPEYKRQEASVAYLKNIIEAISEELKTNYKDFLKEETAVSKLKSKIRRIIGVSYDVIDISWQMKYISLLDSGISEYEARKMMRE